MFKAGDTVVGNQNSEVNGVSFGTLYQVQKVDGRYVNVGGNHWVLASRFDAWNGETDAVPTAPESGVYFNHNGRRWASLEIQNSRKTIALGTYNTLLKVRLTPETARAMASDLYRMARQLEKGQAE